MPDTDALFTDGSKNALAAVLLMQAGTLAMDVYSAVNSSPWTAENFGGDAQKAASCREYVWHGVILTAVFVIGASAVSRSWWPIIGGTVAAAYMYWLYDRALSRGAMAGSTGWQKGSQ